MNTMHLVDEIIDRPETKQLLSRANDVKDLAFRLQESALAVLNVPSAAELDRLFRRVKSMSQRLEQIEDTLARIEVAVTAAGKK
ncbi:hypothetical protein [Nocardia sp. NBC_01388]|uniref:hypothetical protein n=1 Tax=Nocardia sp. NBC_01388 TaxID=2903596 RepID=UPI0032513CAE